MLGGGGGGAVAQCGDGGAEEERLDILDGGGGGIGKLTDGFSSTLPRILVLRRGSGGGKAGSSGSAGDVERCSRDPEATDRVSYGVDVL